MKVVTASICVIFTTLSAHAAFAADVACNVEDYKGSATVFFGKITGDYNLDNFHNGGSMSINVLVEGNGNKYEHQASVRVTKTDTYIEPTRGAHISELPASIEQFVEQFGPFATVSCTLME